jgi:hypothetical protein
MAAKPKNSARGPAAIDIPKEATPSASATPASMILAPKRSTSRATSTTMAALTPVPKA